MTPKTLTVPEAQNAAFESNGLLLQSMKEFLNEPDEVIAWLVEELLPAGGIGELVAKPKVGKSTLARCLAVAIARGEPFLGRATARGPVIYCAFEEKRSEVRRHFRQLGVTADDPIHVLIGATPDDFLVKLADSIATLHPVLVIIDPMVRLTRVKDLSAYAEVAQALEPVLNLARESGAHVLLVHHGRKSEGEGGDQSLGSTAIFGTCDTGLFLRKRDGIRYIVSEERYGRGFETEFVLPLDPATGWVMLGTTRQEHAQQERAPAILEWLGQQIEPVEERALIEALDGSNALLQGALRQLVKEGQITRTGAGKKGAPYRYAVQKTEEERVLSGEGAERGAGAQRVESGERAAPVSTLSAPAYIPEGRKVETEAAQEPLPAVPRARTHHGRPGRRKPRSRQ